MYNNVDKEYVAFSVKHIFHNNKKRTAMSVSTFVSFGID